MSENRFKYVAFDADDTLWHNMTVFTKTQDSFRSLLTHYHDDEWINQKLEETEIRNLRIFGYGVKGFTLSMIETAIELTEGRVSGEEIQQIIELGKDMLDHPIELLEHVEATVRALAHDHRLMIITKGDLFDQETKIARSGLGDYFALIDVVSEKDAAAYERILTTYDIEPEDFLMVGNSLKSDILPVLAIGAYAVHIPYHVTWVHEQLDDDSLDGESYVRLKDIGQLPGWLNGG